MKSTSENLPLISIVIPVFNAVDYIESAIQSIIQQNYQNLELIVIDGGSTDGTVSILEKFSTKFSYWESVSDRGQTHALNKGFRKANGVLRGWINADEEYLPDTLNKVAKIYASGKSVDLIFGGRILLDMTCQPAMETVQLQPAIAPFNLTLYTGRILFTDATFWSKSLHEMTGVLDEINYF